MVEQVACAKAIHSPGDPVKPNDNTKYTAVNSGAMLAFCPCRCSAPMLSVLWPVTCAPAPAGSALPSSVSQALAFHGTSAAKHSASSGRTHSKRNAPAIIYIISLLANSTGFASQSGDVEAVAQEGALKMDIVRLLISGHESAFARARWIGQGSAWALLRRG
eukprot:2212849-Amphidinium_carterae.2